jgi:hypothetical protein
MDNHFVVEIFEDSAWVRHLGNSVHSVGGSLLDVPTLTLWPTHELAAARCDELAANYASSCPSGFDRNRLRVGVWGESRAPRQADFPDLTPTAYVACVAYNMVLPGTGMTNGQRTRVAAFLTEAIHQVEIAGWRHAREILNGIAKSLGG